MQTILVDVTDTTVVFRFLIFETKDETVVSVTNSHVIVTNTTFVTQPSCL